MACIMEKNFSVGFLINYAVEVLYSFYRDSP